MRLLSTLVAALAIVAGCASAQTASPGTSGPVAAVSPTAGPANQAATAAPPATSAPAAGATASASASRASAVPALPTPVTEKVTARVTFDGHTCAYAGATEIPFARVFSIEFAPTPAVGGAYVAMFAIHPKTTDAQLNDPANPAAGGGVPWFVYKDTWMFQQGPGTYEYPMGEVDARDGVLYDTYDVLCLLSLPGTPTGGQTVLHVVSPGASPGSSAQP